jgi:hypothetical protein
LIVEGRVGFDSVRMVGTVTHARLLAPASIEIKAKKAPQHKRQEGLGWSINPPDEPAPVFFFLFFPSQRAIALVGLCAGQTACDFSGVGIGLL